MKIEYVFRRVFFADESYVKLNMDYFSVYFIYI